MRSYLPLFLLLTVCCGVSASEKCTDTPQQSRISFETVERDLRYLASDALKGRASGKEGAKLAREYIAKRYSALQLASIEGIADSFTQYYSDFILDGLFQDRVGTNVIAVAKGTLYPEHVVVFTAHYDHIGIQRGKVHPGADDNASGVSALLAIASQSAASPPKHTHLFVATEYEEEGLLGAKAFVENPPVNVENIKLNINLDMLSQPGYRKKLYIAGTKQSPWLRTLLKEMIDAKPCATFGHDGRTKSRYQQDYIDWRRASDHWAFARKGIPYLFFGVDEHRFYHKPSDSVDKVDWPFYFHAVQTVADTVNLIDQYHFN